MTDDEIKYRAFKVVWKVLGQVRPGIMNEERFLIALDATSDDKFKRIEKLNPGKLAKLRQMRAKNVIE